MKQKLVLLTLFLAQICLGQKPGNFTPQPSKKVSNEIQLPEQVPYLNTRENYLVGNGIICASGAGDGKLSFIAGPDYTGPNFISSERISITINNVEHQLSFDMFRARETGNFYGVEKIGGLEITLLDYTLRETSAMSRLVIVKNISNKEKYLVQLNAYLTPQKGSGRKDFLLKNNRGKNSAVWLQLDTTLYCMFGDTSSWVKNWANRSLVTTWQGEQTRVQKKGIEYQISSAVKNISINKSETFTLSHYAHYNDITDEDCVRNIRSGNGVTDAAKSIAQWKKWFRDVPPEFSLAKIKDQRARDIAEGGLYFIKTNQTHDGGLIAEELEYNLSWMRDAYCGLRGMLAFGHTLESKQFIKFMNSTYHSYGFIPNAVTVGKDVFALYNGNSINNPNRYLGQLSPCPESNTAPETPALLILTARDYYRETKDLTTVIEADASLKYSMDIQLKHAINNGYKLEFSGDETELCGAVNTEEAGYSHKRVNQLWSMSSIALMISSLEFYNEYLLLTHRDPSSYTNSIDGKVLNLNNELQKLRDAIDTDFWRAEINGKSDGLYDWCRVKTDNNFPIGRIVNLSLFPVYYKTKLNSPERIKTNILTIKKYFVAKEKYIPLVPESKQQRYLGHNLGYLLWSLIEINDKQKDLVYDALVNGKSVQCWGTYNEAYDKDGTPNEHNLRIFETGVNIDAIGKYWSVGR